MSYLKYIQAIANTDVAKLKVKDSQYGGSWRRRGGMGAFMMLARKWDRIENIIKEDRSVPGIGSARSYDIFEHGELNHGDVLDDIRDLRQYLILVEAELIARGQVKIEHVEGRENL